MTFCPDCFLDVDDCIECNQPLSQIRNFRVKKRQVGHERTKERLISIIIMSAITMQKYNSNEMKSLYQTKMFDFVEGIRASFIETLE
jgi:hypothetical protein